MNERMREITEAPIWKLLYKMTLPMIFGMLGLVIFNMIDTYYVSQLGLIPMAAMTLTFPVVMIIGSLAQGIGIGAAALVSKAVGENKHDKIVRLITDSLLLSLLLVFIFVLVGFLTIEPLFKLLGADQTTMPYVIDYMKIWYGGVMFLIVPMVGNANIRALGDTKTPAIIMTVAALANAVMDPILIFGLGPIPAMGIKGAALATVFSRAFTMAVSMYVLAYKQKIVSFKGLTLSKLIASFKKLLYIGVPNALTRMIVPLAVGIITSHIATFGQEATAGFGIATRIEMFAMLILNSLASIYVPLVGQNLGAGKTHRVKEIVHKSQLFSMIYGVFIFVFLFAFGKWIAGFFTDIPAVIDTVSRYLTIVSLGYGLQGLFLIYTNTLNVTNKPMQSALLSLIRLFIIYIPLALLLSSSLDLTGIWIALNISFVITSIMGYFMTKKSLPQSI